MSAHLSSDAMPTTPASTPSAADPEREASGQRSDLRGTSYAEGQRRLSPHQPAAQGQPPDPDGSGAAARASDEPELASPDITYTVNNAKAYLREPDNPLRVLKRSVVVSKNAWVRHEDNHRQTLKASDVDSLPAGTDAKRGKVRLKPGTEVTIVGGDPDTDTQRVRYGGAILWTATGNLKTRHVALPAGTVFDKVTSFLHGGKVFAKMRHEGEDVVTAMGNLTRSVSDMTFATRMQADDKRGLEQRVPKRHNPRFELDGTIAVGALRHGHARRRNTRTRLGPKGTRLLVLEREGRFLRVLDLAGTWNAEAATPGWWVHRSAVSGRHNERIDPSTVSHPAVKAVVENHSTKDGSAADSHITTGALTKAAQRVVALRRSARRMDAHGKRLGKVPRQQPRYIFTETLQTKDSKGKPLELAKIIALDGTEFLVRRRDVLQYRTDRGYGLEQKDGKLELVMSMDQGAKDNVRYPICQAAADALQVAFRKAVDEEVGKHDYTANQEILLKMAREFAANPYAQRKTKAGGDIVDLVIPADAIEDTKGPSDGMKLDPDLMARMGRFYRFLQYATLITGPPPRFSGIRSTARAHQLAVKWTFSPKSGLMANRTNRHKFARRVIALGGAPDAAGDVYADPAETERLRVALEQAYTPVLPKGVEVADLATEEAPGDPIADALETVDAIVATIRERAKGFGKQATQDAPAAEGFLRGDPRRLPNINDGAGVSNHCGGEAIDVTFPFVFNYYDPIIDAVAAYFGLHRPIKDSGNCEHWHYERLGIDMGERRDAGEAADER